jgi:phosphoribosylformylglycinamidine synthase
VLNRYFFCFASPGDTTKLYRDQEQNQPMLSAKQILHGVVEGVGDGGNQSGVNTPQGGLFIDHRYRGKPLVFAGTVGLLRRSIAATGQPAHQKQARPGDLIVLIGGKVGLDGIHGATFSSEGLHGNSPVSAVQIGDPITQKKFSDLLIHQARDQGLYTSITDNGAGGLSCSVAEMARESNGCRVELDTVPLKYPGLAPWQIWISESQERMTLAVPPEHWPAFQRLCQSHGVMAASIGQFTDSGSCVVTYQDTTVMELSLSFLHDGLPSRPMQTKRPQRTLREPYLYLPEEMTDELVSMMGRESIVSTAWISQQYDHEVQGGSVLKPLQGRGRVNAEATVVRPVLTEDQAVAVSQSLYPTYGDIDPYHMVAAAIDTAVRNLVATGVPLDRIALLDNFCWSQSDQSERLYELKQAAEACYDYATAYETPFISGKDSMFNEFQGYDDRGNPIEIAVPPTVLISSVGVMPDFRRAVSIDLKQPGDLIYLLGETDDELGGSEYYAMYAEIGLHVPKVDAARNRSRYQRLSAAIANGLVSSAISVTRGGLAVALAKTALAGRYGVQIDLDAVRGQWLRYDHALFAESQGRVVVSVRPDQQASFEACFEPGDCACIGQVTEADDFRVDHDNEPVVLTNLSMLGSRYYNGLDMI